MEMKRFKKAVQRIRGALSSFKEAPPIAREAIQDEPPPPIVRRQPIKKFDCEVVFCMDEHGDLAPEEFVLIDRLKNPGGNMGGTDDEFEADPGIPSEIGPGEIGTDQDRKAPRRSGPGIVRMPEYVPKGDPNDESPWIAGKRGFDEEEDPPA